MRPELLDLASRLAARGEAFAVVTVVRREPPSSARVGDAAVVTRGGEIHGWVGGGCTRSTLLRESLRAIADGEPRLLSLSPEPGTEHRPGLVALPMSCKSGGVVDLYVEPVLPAPRLLLFGTSLAARTLARIGHAMGYRIDVVDPEADQSAYPHAERILADVPAEGLPQGAYVLVATMSERDLEAIEAAVRFAPAYLGLISSRTRLADLRKTLLGRGVAAEAIDRIVAPAGLDIGARSPEEIALSVMAQIVELRRRSAAKTQEIPVLEKPLEAIDPICGMMVALAAAKHVADFAGRNYYFCCGGCRTKFLADPARYAGAGAASS